MAQIFICIVLSYLVGSIPTSIIVSKLIRGIDIRNYGSGNAGFANTARVLGWRPAAIVFIFDLAKGFAVTFWLPDLFIAGAGIQTVIVQILSGTAAVVGHIWTIFASFKGGKGVLTALGMFLALLPFPTILCAVIAGLMMYFFKFVSLGSITGGVCLPILTGIQKYLFGAQIPGILFLFSIVIAVLIVFTHRANIKRLMSGTETRIGRIKMNENP